MCFKSINNSFDKHPTLKIKLVMFFMSVLGPLPVLGGPRHTSEGTENMGRSSRALPFLGGSPTAPPCLLPHYQKDQRTELRRKGLGWFCPLKSNYDNHSSYFKLFFYGGAKFHNFSLDWVNKLLVKMVQIPQNTAEWIWKKWKRNQHAAPTLCSCASLSLPYCPRHKTIARSSQVVKDLFELSTPQTCRPLKLAYFHFSF